MQHDPRAFLWDVRQAADRAAAFIEGRTLDAYLDDRLLRSATERQLTIVGEALNQLSRTDAIMAACVPNLRHMVEIRNILVEAYTRVDHVAVWRTASVDLPKLRATAAALLAELGDTP